MMLTVIVLNVMSSDPKVLLRDVEASVVPIGTKVTLQKGETAHITQSLGGAYTVIVNGNMFRIAEKDADALGIEAKAAASGAAASGAVASAGPITQDQLEKQVWESLKTCYDPEITWARAPRLALAPRIRVNCVTPGLTITPMGQETIAALDPDYAKNKMLLQRYATPEEIAQVIVFLASPLNSFMTGATVDVNGGRDLR